MHEENTKLAREVVADIEGFFAGTLDPAVPWAGARVYRPAVRRHIKLAECASYGQTIFEYAPDLSGALDYAGLASAVVAESMKFGTIPAPAQIEESGEPLARIVVRADAARVRQPDEAGA